MWFGELEEPEVITKTENRMPDLVRSRHEEVKPIGVLYSYSRVTEVKRFLYDARGYEGSYSFLPIRRKQTLTR